MIDTTSSAWTASVDTAVSDWSRPPSPLTLAKIPGTANKRCSPVSGKAQVCNRTYGNNGWLGLATIWIVGTTHIAQATTKLNDTYFNTSTYNNPNERAHVACQEIGHDFGLDHQDTSGADFNTCMDYFSNTGDPNARSTDSTHPNQGDYDQLLCIYDPATKGTILSSPPHSCISTGHLDASNTWSAMGVVQAPGRDGVFVSRDGNLTEITSVFWANPIH